MAVAAETANQYLGLRACEALLAQARLDAASRNETARLTELSMQSGFESRANAALARASAAQGLLVTQQQGEQCEQAVKALVALTGLPEPELRAALGTGLGTPARAGAARGPGGARVGAGAAPRRVRPRARRDRRERRHLRSARRAVPAHHARGHVGAARFESGFGSFKGNTWSVGPVTVSLPLFDAGARRANVVAARARYDEATSAYAATLRDAVRDVENALIALQSTADRNADAQVAAENFERSYRATEARYKSGFGTLFELEDARRSALAAQNTLIDLRRERVAAWIALYRALGGGWSALADGHTAATSSSSPTPMP